MASRALTNEGLKRCPNCGEEAGELKKSELPTRLPYRVECLACGFMTGFRKAADIAAKLWNEAKPRGK